MNHHNHRESRIEYQELRIKNRESSYLRAYKALYLRAYKTPLHLSRTLYKSALFMQNKPNFRKSQMNVSFFTQKAYENKSNWTLGESKPNQSQFQKGGVHGYMFGATCH